MLPYSNKVGVLVELKGLLVILLLEVSLELVNIR
jgi:hypothetical protein